MQKKFSKDGNTSVEIYNYGRYTMKFLEDKNSGFRDISFDVDRSGIDGHLYPTLSVENKYSFAPDNHDIYNRLEAIGILIRVNFNGNMYAREHERHIDALVKGTEAAKHFEWKLIEIQKRKDEIDGIEL